MTGRLLDKWIIYNSNIYLLNQLFRYFIIYLKAKCHLHLVALLLHQFHYSSQYWITTNHFRENVRKLFFLETFLLNKINKFYTTLLRFIQRIVCNFMTNILTFMVLELYWHSCMKTRSFNFIKRCIWRSPLKCYVNWF